MSREEVQIWRGGVQDDISGFDIVHDAFVDAGFDVSGIKSYSRGGICLWVSINNQRFIFQDSQPGGQVNC